MRGLAKTQNRADRERRTLVFMDEAAFYLLATTVCTHAPEGETPVLRYPYWHIVSPEPRMVAGLH